MGLYDFFSQTCPRCRGGLIVEDQDTKLRDLVCVNCGFRIPLIMTPITQFGVLKMSQTFIKKNESDQEKFHQNEEKMQIKRHKHALYVREWRKKRALNNE